MEQVGVDFAATGSVLTRAELEDQRRKRGECLTCGAKCFQKKLFKMVPITERGKVLNGRCLNCKPLDLHSGNVVTTPTSRRTTQADLLRFSLSQSRLAGPGVQRPTDPPNLRRRFSELPASRPPPLLQAVSSPAHYQSDATALSASPRTERISPNVATRVVSTSAINESPSANSLQYLAIEAARSDDAYLYDRESSQSMESFGVRSAQSVPHDFVPDRASPESAPVASPEDPIYQAVVASIASSVIAKTYREKKAAELADAERQAAKAAAMSFSSCVAIASEGVAADCSPPHVDEEDYRSPPPSHGILNRGGAVSFAKLRKSRDLNVDSNGTLGSNSSSARAEEESKSPSISGSSSSRRLSRRRAYFADQVSGELSTNAELEALQKKPMARRSNGDEGESQPSQRRNSGNSSRNLLVEEAEDRALNLIQTAGNDYKRRITLMKKHPASAFIQQEAMKGLSMLDLGNDDLEEILNMGALEACVMGLRSHPHEVDVQIQGCCAMWNLSANTKNQVALMNAGALDCILTAMLGFGDDPEVQENALAVIANLCLPEENQKAIIEAGTPDKVVETMNKHAEDATVQCQGSIVFENLSAHNVDFKRKMMEVGAGGSVSVAMIMHPDEVKLQEAALNSLRTMCTDSLENTIAIADVGGIDAAITAMQIHRDEPGVQEAGAWALSVFAVDPENQATIGDGGGIDVVVRAMWVHSDVLGVAEWCCSALWKLTEDIQNRDFVIEVGGISALINAMQAYVDEAAVQRKALGVLKNLALDDYEYKVRIVEEEAVDAMVMAMVLHPDNMQIQREGCKAFVALAVEINFERLRAANVMELVKTAASKFPVECGQDSSRFLEIL